MKKLIIVCLFACLTGCLTPTSFRGRYAQKSERNTTYKVTDFKHGFRIDMTYYKFEALGTSSEINFEARNKLKKLALWIAEARKRKIRKLTTKDIKSAHYHNTVTQHTSWRGHVRVYYTKK